MDELTETVYGWQLTLPSKLTSQLRQCLPLRLRRKTKGEWETVTVMRWYFPDRETAEEVLAYALLLEAGESVSGVDQ